MRDERGAPVVIHEQQHGGYTLCNWKGSFSYVALHTVEHSPCRSHTDKRLLGNMVSEDGRLKDTGDLKDDNSKHKQRWYRSQRTAPKDP